MKPAGEILYHFGPRSRTRRGTVLIVVMWIMLGLVSITLFFCDAMVLEYRASDNITAGLEAEHAIEGARRYIFFVLGNLEVSGSMPDIENYEAEKVSIGDASFWIIGRCLEEECSDITPAFGLVDEASKLDLNTATPEMLEGLPGMTNDLAASIIDWRDTDMDLTPNGAESQYYLMRDPPYNCKDSPFETVDELRLVMGAEWDLIYGEDTNRNGILDPNEDDGDKSFPEDNGDGKLDPGLVEYLTVYTREPNTRQDGSGRINIRNTPNPDLSRLLRETFGEQRGEQIERAVGQGLQDIRSILEYYIRSRMTQDEFSKIQDALTVSNDQYLEGRINVNTASAAVLACLPGVGEEFARKLVDARSQKSSEDLKIVSWVTEVLDTQRCIQAGPCLTTKTYQFSADMAALGHLGRGFRRTLFIFDTSSGQPAVIYRRDLTRLGWPLGSAIRDEFDVVTEERRS